MGTGQSNEGGRVAELKRIYLWAARHHKTKALHAAARALHIARGSYCAWERHIDGGHSA